MKKPLHARLGFVATTTTLVVATVGMLVVALGHQASTQSGQTVPVTPPQQAAEPAPDLSTCDRFTVITNIIDCGIFNPEDAETCSACKISGQ